MQCTAQRRRQIASWTTWTSRGFLKSRPFQMTYMYYSSTCSTRHSADSKPHPGPPRHQGSGLCGLQWRGATRPRARHCARQARPGNLPMCEGFQVWTSLSEAGHAETAESSSCRHPASRRLVAGRNLAVMRHCDNLMSSLLKRRSVDDCCPWLPWTVSHRRASCRQYALHDSAHTWRQGCHAV